MLLTYRMWRFVRLVKKENEAIGYKDPVMVGFHADERYKYVVEATVLDQFRVLWWQNDKRKYIAERTLKAAVAKGYLKCHYDRPVVKLEVDSNQGEDFVTVVGLVKTVFRELNFWEQVLTSGLFFGLYRIIMACIDRIGR